MDRSSSSSECIGIVGLGLIGGSIGLDLKAMGKKVIGLTHKTANANRAKERGIVEVASTNPSILNDCSMVIIALPLSLLLNPSQELINSLPKNAVITDVGSVKTPILKIWRNLHPRFIASHPMAGTHEAGIEAGQKNLFKGKPWIATPELTTDQEALEKVHQLALSLGCRWVTSKAELHDEAVSLISHLPVFVSAALLSMVAATESADLLELTKALASTGFADITRIGGGNPDLGTSMAKYNNEAILNSFEKYRVYFDKFEEKIRSKQWEKINIELQKNQMSRPSFIQDFSDFNQSNQN